MSSWRKSVHTSVHTYASPWSLGAYITNITYLIHAAFDKFTCETCTMYVDMACKVKDRFYPCYYFCGLREKLLWHCCVNPWIWIEKCQPVYLHCSETITYHFSSDKACLVLKLFLYFVVCQMFLYYLYFVVKMKPYITIDFFQAVESCFLDVWLNL